MKYEFILFSPWLLNGPGIQALRILGLEFAVFEILCCCRVVWASGFSLQFRVQVSEV